MLAPLGDLCSFINGGTPEKSRAHYWDGPIPWITSADIADDEVKTPRSNISEAALQNSAAAVVERGAVLLVTRTGVGKVAQAPSSMSFSQDITAILPDDQVLDRRYLARFLSSKRNYFERHARGATIKGVTREVIERLQIPLPPLDEQRRIAAILDKADALRRKRKRALELLDGLTQSIFLEMFGDPVTNSCGLATAKVGDLCEVVTGNTPPRVNAALYGAEVEWIKSDNIRPPERVLSVASEFLSLKGRSVARLAPPGSTLVTCIAGSPNSIGNCAMADREVAFNQQINALLPRALNPLFLYAQLRVGKKLVQNASTGGMKGLVSKSRLQDVMMLAPPRSHQDAFAERAQRVLDLADRVRAATESDMLFASLQNRAFRGQL